MSQLPRNRCGYTYPGDHEVREINDRPFHQSCCWRETVDGSEYCVWHADSDKVPKSSQALQEARSSVEVRQKTRRPAELLDGADLAHVDLHDINFERTSLRHCNFSEAHLDEVNLSETLLFEADFSEAHLHFSNLSDAVIENADFSEASILGTNFSEASLRWATFSMADLKEVWLPEANLKNADLSRADLGPRGSFDSSNLSGANLENGNLSDTNLQGANLLNANLEHATLVRTNLFDANLTNSSPHGATFTDVQINDDSEIRSEEIRKEDARWWQKGLLFPPQRCVYDPEQDREFWMEYVPGFRFLYQKFVENSQHDDHDQLGKAADTYQTFEKLARENARPSLQSEMFVLRQDMQRKRHWYSGEYFKWSFARVSRAVFKHGESLGRIMLSAFLIVLGFGAVYSQFDLIIDADGEFIRDPVDSIYFSTLTFTTLGLGDFQPSPASEFARALVTTQAALGAILIAVFVFVLGRRAAK